MANILQVRQQVKKDEISSCRFVDLCLDLQNLLLEKLLLDNYVPCGPGWQDV